MTAGRAGDLGDRDPVGDPQRARRVAVPGAVCSGPSGGQPEVLLQ